MLVILDQIFSIFGIVILVAWTKRISTAGPGHSLVGQPSLPFREDAVLFAMLGYLAAAMILSGLMQSLGHSSDQILAGLVVNNGSQLFGITSCLILAVSRVPGGIRSFLLGEPIAVAGRRRLIWLTVSCFSVTAIGVCPLIRDATSWFIRCLVPDFQFEAHPTLQALDSGGLSMTRVIVLWVGAALIAPVSEEMFFRGILQNFLAGATNRTGLSIVLAAVAFAAVHVSQPHAVPALFFLGVLLGVAYHRTGTLIVPIAIHAAFNLKTLVWETLERQWS